jgi:hypothetical protein
LGEDELACATGTDGVKAKREIRSRSCVVGQRFTAVGEGHSACSAMETIGPPKKAGPTSEEGVDVHAADGAAVGGRCVIVVN